MSKYTEDDLRDLFRPTTVDELIIKWASEHQYRWLEKHGDFHLIKNAKNDYELNIVFKQRKITSYINTQFNPKIACTHDLSALNEILKQVKADEIDLENIIKEKKL